MPSYLLSFVFNLIVLCVLCVYFCILYSVPNCYINCSNKSVTLGSCKCSARAQPVLLTVLNYVSMCYACFEQIKRRWWCRNAVHIWRNPVHSHPKIRGKLPQNICCPLPPSQKVGGISPCAPRDQLQYCYTATGNLRRDLIADKAVLRLPCAMQMYGINDQKSSLSESVIKFFHSSWSQSIRP